MWDYSLPGIPLPGPVPILYFLARSREAGPVPARYPIGSVTTVYNFHTFHCKYSPCPELAVTQRFGEHRDSGNFPGFRSPCTTPNPKPSTRYCKISCANNRALGPKYHSYHSIWLIKTLLFGSLEVLARGYNSTPPQRYPTQGLRS